MMVKPMLENLKMDNVMEKEYCISQMVMFMKGIGLKANRQDLVRIHGLMVPSMRGSF